LKKAQLAYQAPAPPDVGSETARMDLVMVEAAQTMPASHEWQEANGDARAYDADKVIRRFEDAWGGALSADKRPILVFVLTRVIQDTSGYAGIAKAAWPRPRPYVGHPEIVPCDRGPPEHPIKDQESYPSGHSMNGYVIGSLLADLKPARDQALLARGVRYGDNRIVCGVHHPIDVQQGRLLGIAYLAALRADPVFKTEFDCAKQEDQHLADSAVRQTDACLALVTPKPGAKVLQKINPTDTKPNPVHNLN
jgi:acid phosphatase (class A)